CAKNGTSCNGAVLYVTTQPCVFCCIALIQAGIKKVVFKGEYPTGLGLQLLEESGVEYIKYEDELESERKSVELKQKDEAKRIEEFLSKPKRY
ncbi:MAG: deoxycytidylate deaminase, partial [Paraclostridium dentum]